MPSAKQYLAARVAERAAVAREDRSGTRGRLFRLWHEITNAVRAELPRISDAELRAFLMQKRTERAAHLLTLKRTPEVSAVDRMIEDLARSPERLREDAAAAIARDEEQRRRLLRHIR